MSALNYIHFPVCDYSCSMYTVLGFPFLVFASFDYKASQAIGFPQ